MGQLSGNDSEIAQHGWCHPYRNKNIDIAKLEFDGCIWAFGLIEESPDQSMLLGNAEIRIQSEVDLQFQR